MKFLLPLLLLFSLSLYGSSSEMKLETMLSHLSSSTDSDRDLVIEENLHGGKILKLSNGTIWEVAPQDVKITEIWIFPFPLELKKSTNSAYPYYLINKNSKTKVLVRPLSGPEKTQTEQPSSSPSQQQPKQSPYPAPQRSPQQQSPPVPTPTPLDH